MDSSNIHFGRHRLQILVTIWTIIIIMVQSTITVIKAQQEYNNTDGYTCNGESLKTCTTYALYRTFQPGESLQKVGEYFNKTPQIIATASGMTAKDTVVPLKQGQALYVPVDCTCVVTSQPMMMMQVFHTIVSGDTFWLLSVTVYGGLTTYQMMEKLNPTKDVYNLTIGDSIAVPIFCACPTPNQVANGTRILLTYTVYPDETIDTISDYFGITTVELTAANRITTNSPLETNTTILIPLATSLPPISTIAKIPSPSPSPSPRPLITPPIAPRSVVMISAYTPLYVGIAVGGLGLTVAVVSGAILVICKVRLQGSRVMNLTEHSHGSSNSNIIHPELGMHVDNQVNNLDIDLPVTMLSFREIQVATDGFSDANLIKGSVFRGRIGERLVAVKQVKMPGRSVVSQEMKILSQLRHSNVVELVGMCIGGGEEAEYLVYEYAENGSLNDCLRTNQPAMVGWVTRLGIALDVASGLDYIHNYVCNSSGFVHLDVKSSNILLDGEFRAKVANFGMAKNSSSSVLVTRHIVGTHGYMAPEYLHHGLVSVKCDVFAFGVVLLELLSGKEAMNLSSHDQTPSLSETIHDVLDLDTTVPDHMKIQGFMDPLLQFATFPVSVAIGVAALARTCVDADPALRPTMKDVTFALSKMLAASQEWESSASSLPIEEPVI